MRALEAGPRGLDIQVVASPHRNAVEHRKGLLVELQVQNEVDEDAGTQDARARGRNDPPLLVAAALAVLVDEGAEAEETEEEDGVANPGKVH